MSSVYEEAWKSFQKEIETDRTQEPHTHLYTPAGILVLLIDHLEKTRQRAKEYQRKIKKEIDCNNVRNY